MLVADVESEFSRPRTIGTDFCTFERDVMEVFGFPRRVHLLGRTTAHEGWIRRPSAQYPSWVLVIERKVTVALGADVIQPLILERDRRRAIAIRTGEIDLVGSSVVSSNPALAMIALTIVWPAGRSV